MRCYWPSALRSFANHTPERVARLQVSSHGRILNAKGVIWEGSLRASGYRILTFHGQKWPVHRVVKITFDGLPPNAEAWQVHHLDGDPSNNRLDNLEYVTQSENTRHSYSNPLRGRSGPAHSKMAFWRPVGATTWKISPSTVLAAQQLGMSQSTVSKCCRENSVAKGYEFKFQDPLQNTLPGEEWRPMLDPTSGKEIPGRMVSSVGRIMSKTGLVSRGCLTPAGYYLTGINSDGQTVLVHRLVAFAYLGPPPCAHQHFVNHKDLDKSNNAADNLEWVSCAENNAHFQANAAGKCRSDVKPIWSRRHGTDDEWTRHDSMALAERELGLGRGRIQSYFRRNQKQSGGYQFRLAEETELALLAGERWREVDVSLLQQDKEARKFAIRR